MIYLQLFLSFLQIGALSFGGGGHVKAAGCTMTGEPQEIVEKISGKIREQWEELK